MRWEAKQLASLARRGPYAVAFLGDSITAGLAGGGRRLGKRLEAAEKALGGRVGMFGVPGDKVENLAWRLANGGLPAASLYVVQIGTNDVWLRDRPSEIAGRIRELTGYLRAAAPEAHIVLLSLFWLCEKEPQRRAINDSLRSFCGAAGDPRLHYSAAGEDLPIELFPDGVHPEPEAWEQVLDSLLPLIEELLQR
ncbi:hypothetical protein ABPG75_001456 [Micractinium tetrahymenae]